MATVYTDCISVFSQKLVVKTIKNAD